MSRVIRYAILAGLSLSLAACATPPEANPTPPPKPRLDAKADLEQGAPRRR